MPSKKAKNKNQMSRILWELLFVAEMELFLGFWLGLKKLLLISPKLPLEFSQLELVTISPDLLVGELRLFTFRKNILNLWIRSWKNGENLKLDIMTFGTLRLMSFKMEPSTILKTKFNIGNYKKHLEDHLPIILELVLTLEWFILFKKEGDQVLS